MPSFGADNELWKWFLSQWNFTTTGMIKFLLPMFVKLVLSEMCRFHLSDKQKCQSASVIFLASSTTSDTKVLNLLSKISIVQFFLSTFFRKTKNLVNLLMIEKWCWPENIQINQNCNLKENNI